jgi:hypothetical protein
MASRCPSTKTIEEISALPPAQVKADLDAIQAAKRAVEARRAALAAQLQQATDEETRLTRDEQLLSLVLRMHRDAFNGVPNAADILSAQAAAAPLARERNISANVLAIVRQARGMAVQPSYVLERLADVGIEEADAKVVRTALRRWVARGELLKEGRGYRSRDHESRET